MTFWSYTCNKDILNRFYIRKVNKRGFPLTYKTDPDSYSRWEMKKATWLAIMYHRNTII